MKALSIQVQPHRAPAINMDRLRLEFEKIATSKLVAHHDFDSGEDNGPYYNFTFGTNRAADLWQQIVQTIYESDDFRVPMRASSMAMCSSDDGWDDYLLLFHFDPKVKLDDTTAL